MKRGSKGFFVPVLFSLVCLPIVSAVLFGLRWKKAGLEDRNSGFLNFVAVLYFFCAAFAVLVTFLPTTEGRQRAWDLREEGYTIAQVDSMAALPGNVENKAIDPVSYSQATDKNMRISSMFLGAIPMLAAGIFLLLIRAKLNKINQEVDQVLRLVNQGSRHLDDFQEHFPYTIDPIRIGKEIVNFDLLPGYIVNFKERRLVPKGEFENENKMVSITWACSSCNANNSVRIKRSDQAVCEFCGVPKVGGPPPRPA